MGPLYTLALLVWPLLINAQNVSTYTNPSVPTGTPVPGSYSGALRPQVHYSPPQHFMNDPNGMFLDASGTWHLYYQFNPTGIAAGNQHWGHATSRDLYHWINQPIALFPPEERVYVFSGSVVVDTNNTSGFFPGQDNGVVAILTLARYDASGTGGAQTQALAYSFDDGYTFQYYSGNPVLDINSTQFRDPKVIWYEDHWVMVISYADYNTVGFYTSPDLKNWTHASNFSRPVSPDAQYECPNLVKMPVRDQLDGSVTGSAWVLAISINPGAPLGGSITFYFPGGFNGTHFEAARDNSTYTDFGKDNYAAQYFYGTPDGSNAVNIGWASNWQYTQLVPTGPLEGWRSSMSLPRENYLVDVPGSGYTMIQEVYNLTEVTSQELAASSWQGNGSLSADFSGTKSNAVLLDLNATGLVNLNTSPGASLNLSFEAPQTGEALLARFDAGGNMTFYVDRSAVRGFSDPNFTPSFNVSGTVNATTGAWRMQAVLDRSVFEVFLGGGLHAGTFVVYPTEPLTRLVVRSQGLPGSVGVSVSLTALASAWESLADANGVVRGNVTTTK